MKSQVLEQDVMLMQLGSQITQKAALSKLTLFLLNNKGKERTDSVPLKKAIGLNILETYLKLR